MPCNNIQTINWRIN